MRFSNLFALGAVVASPAFASAEVVKRTASVQTIIADFAAIMNGTIQLTGVLNNFTGPRNSLDLLQAVAAVDKIVQQGIKDVQGTAVLSVNDAIQLTGPTSNLGIAVNESVAATINKKELLVNSGLGPETERQLLKLQTTSNAFSSDVVAIIPSSLQETAQSLASPISESLQIGVNAFANTTIPKDVDYSGAGNVAARTLPVAAGALLVAALLVL